MGDDESYRQIVDGFVAAGDFNALAIYAQSLADNADDMSRDERELRELLGCANGLIPLSQPIRKLLKRGSR